MTEWFKDNKYVVFSLIIIFLISLLFPLSGDDWPWKATALNMDFIKNMSNSISINGRYIANIIVMLLTKSIILRGIIIAIVLVGICEIIYCETKINRLYFWILFLLMPKDILRQSIIWASGFTNYTISILLLLIDILCIEKLFSKNVSWLKGIFLLFLFFVSSFFIENLTIFLLLFSFVMNIIYLIKNKKLNLNMQLAFIGSLIGNIVMFSQAAYHNVITGADGYRTIAMSFKELLNRILNNCGITMVNYCVIQNVFVVSFLVIILYVYYIKKCKKNKFISLFFIYMFMYIFYILCLKINPNWSILMKHTYLFNEISTFTFLILLFANIIVLFKNHNDFKRILLIISSIIGLLAPLSIVTPIGARNFLMIYILEIFLTLTIFKNIKVNKEFNLVLKLLLVFLIGFYVNIYGYIQLASIRRFNYIEKQVSQGKTTINVPKLPYAEYVWNPDFDSDYLAGAFRLSYNIPNDVEFVFFDYQEWYNNKS